jgi:NtrC-family two-component system sensor histidine kinase KinB
MQRWNQSTAEQALTGLRTKLWFGFGGLLVILLIVSATSVIVLTRYSQTLEQLYHENYDSVRYCDAMKRSLDDLNMAAMNLLWTGQGPSRAADISRFETNLNQELGNATLPGEAQRTRELAVAWRSYNEVWSRFGANPSDRDRIYRGQMLSIFERLQQLTQQISDMNMANMMSVDGQVKQTLTEVRDAVLILVLAGTVASSAFVGGVGASILRSVRSLTRSAREIERGNLDLVVEVDSHDEIGQLAEAFNSMADKLRQFRKSDHDRLLRTQLTTQLAIDSLPDPVFVISPQGLIEIANRTAERYFGISPGVAVTHLQLRWLTELCTRVLTDRNPFETDGYRGAIQTFENQEERFLLPRAVPMISAEGAMLGITVILVDVTRLRHADELKSGLVSTVSHELRTPLTSIRMGVLMLNEEKLGPLTSRQRKSLNAVREDSDRLHRIIENLLSMGRLEAGGEKFQTQRMTAEEIVRLAVESVRPGIGEKGIRLQIELAPDLPSVMADPSCIELALGNLLSNALKFSPPGGQVRVAAQSDANALTFEVQDNGPGIPQEYAARIFQRFFRVPQTGGPAGAGLGLAISKEIVEAHGGRIWFNSIAGGSTFCFTIPFEPTLIPGSSIAQSAETPQPSIAARATQSPTAAQNAQALKFSNAPMS